MPGIFETYFRLTRREPVKSIFETILSRKRFCKNLDLSKIWDPEIRQSAREGQKQRPLATAPTPGHSFLKAFNVVLNALPGVPECSKLTKVSIPGHANLAEYKSGSKCGAPLWQRDLWGESCPAFLRNAEKSEKDRRDPARSIFEMILSRKRFFKNLDFSKTWDPEICQSAREGAKWLHVYYYTPPLAPP